MEQETKLRKFGINLKLLMKEKKGRFTYLSTNIHYRINKLTIKYGPMSDLQVRSEMLKSILEVVSGEPESYHTSLLDNLGTLLRKFALYLPKHNEDKINQTKHVNFIEASCLKNEKFLRHLREIIFKLGEWGILDKMCVRRWHNDTKNDNIREKLNKFVEWIDIADQTEKIAPKAKSICCLLCEDSNEHWQARPI